MKTASGIIALILGLLTMLNIAGCSKAEQAYNEFIAYSNSAPGTVEGFMRGWRGASQGDPFGAVLDVADQHHALQAKVGDARWSAWACLIGTAVALIVYAAIPSEKLTATSPAISASSAVLTPMPSGVPAARHTVEERLRTLLRLKERGLITNEEYDARSRKIMELI